MGGGLGCFSPSRILLLNPFDLAAPGLYQEWRARRNGPFPHDGVDNVISVVMWIFAGTGKPTNKKTDQQLFHRSVLGTSLLTPTPSS